MLNDDISKAISIFRSSPNLDDQEVYEQLVADGVERQLAARLVEFLPIAYCRIILKNKNILFLNTFQRHLPGGGVSQEKEFSSEPVWEAALKFGRDEVARGVSGKELLVVGGRSAEFDAINKLLNTDSKLEDLVLKPIVLTWPEQGPTI